METAKVTSKGQITIPVRVRRRLGLKPGDAIIFVENEGGYRVVNSSLVASVELQEEMRGTAQEAGLSSDEDVFGLVREVRREVSR